MSQLRSIRKIIQLDAGNDEDGDDYDDDGGSGVDDGGVDVEMGWW